MNELTKGLYLREKINSLLMTKEEKMKIEILVNHYGKRNVALHPSLVYNAMVNLSISKMVNGEWFVCYFDFLSCYIKEYTFDNIDEAIHFAKVAFEYRDKSFLNTKTLKK